MVVLMTTSAFFKATELTIMKDVESDVPSQSLPSSVWYCVSGYPSALYFTYLEIDTAFLFGIHIFKLMSSWNWLYHVQPPPCILILCRSSIYSTNVSTAISQGSTFIYMLPVAFTVLAFWGSRAIQAHSIEKDLCTLPTVHSAMNSHLTKAGLADQWQCISSVVSKTRLKCFQTQAATLLRYIEALYRLNGLGAWLPIHRGQSLWPFSFYIAGDHPHHRRVAREVSGTVRHSLVGPSIRSIDFRATSLQKNSIFHSIAS